MHKLVLGILAIFAITNAMALKYTIGDPVSKNGMNIEALYIQSVTADSKSMVAQNKSDIHLEVSIHATKDNPNGFPEGAWIPYLTLYYTIQKVGSNKVIKGTLMPMVANNGPHYGDNVKLDGPGKYNLTYSIFPPSANKLSLMSRHTDEETGVAPWFKNIELTYEFTFASVGKKGTY